MNETFQKLHSWLAGEEAQLLAFLEALVNINSFTANIPGATRAQEMLAGEFSQLGLTVELIAQQGCAPLLLARSPALSTARVLLAGHVDTVHHPESPFNKFSVQGTRAFGPGVADMKAGLAVMLWAAKALAAADRLLELPLVFIINADEEIGSPFSVPVFKEQARQARVGLVFETGRPENLLITRRKGVRVFSVEVSGRAAHAGNEHSEGRNAIVRLAEIILALSRTTDYSLGRTCSIGIVSGGTAENMVPEQAQAHFEFRAVAKEDIALFEENLDALAGRFSDGGFSVRFTKRGGPMPMEELAGTRELLSSYIKAGADCGVRFSPMPSPAGGGSNANDLTGFGLPCLDALGPVGGGAHSREEYVEIPTIAERIETLLCWLLASRIRSV